MWGTGGGGHPSKKCRIKLLRGKNINKKQKKRKTKEEDKKGLQLTKEKKHPLRPGSAGPVAYAAFATRLIRCHMEM